VRPSAGRPRRRRIDRLVWFVLVVLAVYGVMLARASWAVVQYDPQTEVLPFFRWDLFSRVPEPEQQYYGIRFTSLAGATLEEPVYFEQSALPSHSNSSAHVLVQRLGQAVEDGDDDAARYREILESRYLDGVVGATYELVDREYDIEARLECDCFTSEVVIDRFTVGER
jgi:hypothetical protein